ncbi:MAG: PleD family two-component response regulator, partial [Alteromonadales bacterium]
CLIDEADKALYEAKEKGKAQFVLNQAQCLE